MSDNDVTAGNPPEALMQLLIDWINAESWEESQELLQANTEQLLSDQALEALDKLLAENAEDKRATLILQTHKTLLETARAETIEAAYARLPESSSTSPDELSSAIQALLDADDSDALLQQLAQHPILLTSEAIAAIEQFIDQSRQAGSADLAQALEERLKTLKQVAAASSQIDEELAELLIDWINASTWEKSQELLQANAEQLLSSEAFETLNKLLVQDTREDEEEEQKRTRVLLQHKAILELARAETIEAAYAQFRKPSPLASALQALPDELRNALQAMIAVKNPAELIEQIRQHPILLTEEATNAIDKLLDELRQAGQEGTVKHIEERYKTLKEVIESEHDPLNQILNALFQADAPGEVQQVMTEHPLLLEDELLHKISERITKFEQDGNEVIAQVLRLRLHEVQHIRQQQNQASDSSNTVSADRDNYERTTRADRQSIAVGGDNIAPITQSNVNIENYTLPPKGWQQPDSPSLPKTFVGRQKELTELRDYLLAEQSVAITGRTTAAMLQGMGGIGKTYLAVKLAIELETDFPGGVIRLILGPSVMREEDAQVQLRSLAGYALNGIQPQIMSLQPEQVRAWLREMAPGRFLVILDDVWHPAPLRFLERALPTNAVRLVTTRYTSIAKTLGGHMMTLDRLLPEDGLALLEDRLHCQNDTRYQALLKELVALLGGHALALDIAAALIDEPSQTQTILDDLRQDIGRGELSNLSLPPSEERDENLERSLALSYEKMTGEQRSRFRALGVFVPETTLTVEALAAIWNVDERTARKTLLDLKNLALLNKIEGSTDNIYRQHGLLHTYAYALLNKAGELDSARWAHAEYYANLVERTKIDEYSLLDQHIQNIQDTLKWTVKYEPMLFSRLIASLADFLRVRGQLALLEKYLPEAIHVAEATGNKVQQASLLMRLGILESRLGNLDQARAHYDAALPLYRAERARLGEANVYMSLGDMALAQKNWTQAAVYYEQALPLFVAERDPLGQAYTLIDLGRARFELGEHEQGRQDVQRAAALFRSVSDEEWARRAEQYLAAMRKRLEQPGAEAEQASSDEAKLLEAFVNVASSQEMLELVQQNPQLLSDSWFTLVEELIAAQTKEGAKEAIQQRLDTLKAIRHDITQPASQSLQQTANILIDFTRADWAKRCQLLDEQAQLLLSESVEPAFDALLEVNTEPDVVQALEEVRTLLRRCRTWDVEPMLYFELRMRLGDSIDIPAEYEATVMRIATLLSRQREESTALEQAVAAMQSLLSGISSEAPALFRAALLRDLADTMWELPAQHPLRKLEQMELYYREALPLYLAAKRPLSVSFIQRSLGNVLSEQGRYEEALEPLQAAIEGLRVDEQRENDAAWALSAYAAALDKLGRTDEALTAYTEALALLPETPPLLRNRAETLISARRLEEAEADLQRTVALDGNENSPYLWYRRAQLAIAHGNGSLAQQMLEEVSKRDASFDARLEQAQSAWLRNDVNTAQEVLRQALAEANAVDRAAMRRNMQLLFNEHSELAGKGELQKVLSSVP